MSNLEFCLEPDLDTFSDHDLNKIKEKYVKERRNTPHCSRVTVIHPRGQGPIIPSKFLSRIRDYEYFIKSLYWELLQTRSELPPDSYLLDMVPGVHWMSQSWNPEPGESRLVDSQAPGEYVIPEIIRPYVDFINSLDDLRPIIKENFVGVVNFNLKCHLVYDGDGKITLVEEAHPNPDLSLQGGYSVLSRLFHLGKKHPERATGALDWKMNHIFGDRPGVLSPYLHPQFGAYSPTPRPSTWYEQFKKWCHTLLKIESLYASKFDTFHTGAVKRCIVSFDDMDKLTFNITYRNEGDVIMYHPQSLFECFCVFEFITQNMFSQVMKIYNKP